MGNNFHYHPKKHVCNIKPTYVTMLLINMCTKHWHTTMGYNYTNKTDIERRLTLGKGQRTRSSECQGKPLSFQTLAENGESLRPPHTSYPSQ